MIKYIKNNETAGELLKDNSKALEFLHDFRGFDFCKPFEVVKACGAFDLQKPFNDIQKQNRRRLVV